MITNPNISHFSKLRFPSHDVVRGIDNIKPIEQAAGMILKLRASPVYFMRYASLLKSIPSGWCILHLNPLIRLYCLPLTRPIVRNLWRVTHSIRTIEAKIATPVIGEAAVLAPYLPMTTDTIQLLLKWYQSDKILSSTCTYHG